MIADDEEIIGIYGTRYGHNHYFATLGFIVWRPPPGNKRFEQKPAIERPLIDPNSVLAKAVKTMRKLPVFGYTANGAHVPDYEWPKPEQLFEMPIGQPLEVKGIRWKRCDQISTVIGGV